MRSTRSAKNCKLTLALAISVLTGSASLSAADQQDSYCQSAGSKNAYNCSQSQAFQAAQDDIQAKLNELNRWMADEEQAQTLIAVKKDQPESDKLREKIAFNAKLLATELKQAKKLQNSGDVEGAFTQVNDYLVSNPKDPNGWLLYGISLINQNKLNEAADIFSKLSHLYPDSPEPYNNLAVVYARQGDNDKAVEVLLQAFETNPSYAQVQTNLKAVYSALATQAYNRALNLDSSKQPARANLGILDQIYQPTSSQTFIASTTPQVIAQTTPQPATKTAPKAVVQSQPSVNQQPPAKLVIEERDESAGTVPTIATTVVTPPADVVATEPAVTPVSQTATEASTTLKNKAGEMLSESVRTDIQQTINGWATAWAAKDVKAYLRFYTDTYTPNPGRVTHKQWVWGRQQRLGKPAFIKVDITDISLAEAGNGKVRSVFRQKYQSDTYQDEVYKTLTLIQENGQWKILNETTL
ncbi:L,D-transpeptidase Cds6 family protein [Amphritea opalescens]|nr:tetratricopeptide repeat protein [Amphritea opalescens]